jgi:hypothetical protein
MLSHRTEQYTMPFISPAIRPKSSPKAKTQTGAVQDFPRCFSLHQYSSELDGPVFPPNDRPSIHPSTGTSHQILSLGCFERRRLRCTSLLHLAGLPADCLLHTQ